jgi:hypothetical protein
LLSLRGKSGAGSVKKLVLILPLALLLVSCNLFKKSTGGQTAAPPQKKESKSPAFIENISIAPDKKNTVGGDDNNTMPPLPAEPVTIPVIGPELFYQLQFKYAILLDIPVEEMLDHKMIEQLEMWYGTKYRLGGVDKSGVDCSAFVQSFMTAMYGLTLPRTSKEQHAQSVRISKNELKEGDLVFFRTQRRKGISHVGVYLRNNKFVHASTSSGVMISDLSEDYFASRYAGAGRYRID